MRVLSLTLLYGLLTVFSDDSVFEFPPSSAATLLKSVNANGATTVAATNMMFQSTDGGQTWQDISNSFPENESLTATGPEGFFAGGAELYLRVNYVMYHSNSNTSVWEKDTTIPGSAIAFTRSGVMAFNNEGKIWQKTAAGTWSPVYTGFKQQAVETIFETADGSILIGCRSGLYKSADKGKSWKAVKNEGWVMDIAESDGVLIATGQKGIMRSADKGEHWEWVISEGGVGIDVERIDGGFAAISYHNASKSRRIRISEDGGKTWQPIDEGLRSSLSISSIKQTGRYLVLGHPDGIFRSADRGKTWIRVHRPLDNEFQYGGILDTFNDQRKRVFTIYTSGNVVYAVARQGGC
jgi:photosystem II stability/assembly factor-like uncharacterized protein